MAAPLKETYNRVSTDSVKKHTGKDWSAWFALLEKRGASSFTHQEIVAYLAQKQKLTPWWQQVVAVGFEIHAGLRVEGRNLKGSWSATISKALWRPQREVWDFMMSEEGLADWLEPLEGLRLVKGATFEAPDGIFGEVRSFLAPQRLRLRFQDAEIPKPWTLQVWVIARPQGRSIVVFTPEGLSSARERQKQREQWRAAVERLATKLPPITKTKKSLQSEKPPRGKRRPSVK